MDWRVLMRRCPGRSFTVVGEQEQRQSPAGARSWGAVLDRYVADRWTYRQLTVNYRTTGEIMTLAARVLALVDPELRPPDSVRSGGPPPWTRRVSAAGLAAALVRAAAAETAAVGEGSVAVIAPAGVPVPAGLPATVLTPRAAKGLEFDSVVVVEPGRILDAGPHGPAELYVALTRATQRLGILHSACGRGPMRSVRSGTSGRACGRRGCGT
jgi:DNA helicase IV